MRRRLSVLLVTTAALGLTGCPPTGDPPPFAPALPDAAVELCVDSDGDGYVEVSGCPLPPGDCAPEDPNRNPGVNEVCNLVDDDCDGAVDEQNPGGGELCDTGELGVCADGETVCEEGVLVCEQITQPARDESCNARDDDCDGEVDEEVPGLRGRCDTGEPGVCAVGAETCLGGQVECVRSVDPTPEACDGFDNDCDGDVDEGNPGGGGACDTGLRGACAVGAERCHESDIICEATTEPAAENCNGVDDDCDGEVDEDFPELGARCVTGEGACERESAYICNPEGDGVVCDPSGGNQTPEVCNGIDDDCDGLTDEIFAVGEPCSEGVGACAREGLTICAESGDDVVCGVAPGDPVDELCNGADDDCDGEVDEDFPTLGEPCVDESGRCPSPGVLACAADGGVACEAVPVEPVDELCNDFDDDCDGEIDEDFPDKGQPCEVGVGACVAVGLWACGADGAALECLASPGAAGDELCNGVDDDCDGRVDNGATCAGPPAGVVVQMRVAPLDDSACPDITDDGASDNALGAAAQLLNPTLQARFEEGRSPMILRAPGFPAEQLDLEWLTAITIDGAVRPRAGTLTPAGVARARLLGVPWAEDLLSGGAPGALKVVSPVFFAEGEAPYEAASHLELRGATATGPLRAGAEGGLTSEALVLHGWIPRAELLEAYEAADAACADADAPPEGCADRVDPAALAASVSADLERDEAVEGLDAVSVCLILQIDATLDPAHNPAANPIPCEADDDCYQGLACRALPWVAEGAPGAALERRCGLPGEGGLPLDAACARHEDCHAGLCLAVTSEGGRCAALCVDDAPCVAGSACRGVPVPDVEGAVDQGGRSAYACVPSGGSGATCADGCSSDEVCTPWLGGEVGRAGGVVILDPLCGAPTAAADLGEPCASSLDCVRGLGCVDDLEGSAACAPLCDAPAGCWMGQICVDRPFMAATDTQAALLHGVCLAVPEGLGGGQACEADAECAPAETCAQAWLSRVLVHERWCALGEGFFSVGQPCDADGDCASGRCLDGYCAAGCLDRDDCGGAHGCVADAWRDDEGRVVSDGCAPASAACVRDRDCNTEEPELCAGDRCVCDDGACRLGCREGGVCADNAWCRPDGVCGAFCRDDVGEPNDTAAEATPLAAGRAAPQLERMSQLCGHSPTDWYAFDVGGQPFTARVVPLTENVVFELGLYTEAGEPIVEALRGDVTLELGLEDPDEAAARLGEILKLRVRGSGDFDRAVYRLEIDTHFPECPDPADEPLDESWEFTELLTGPGLADAEDVEGWVCPQDVDWYGVWLSSGDRLTVDLDHQGNPINDVDAIELDLLGPDFPELGHARVLAQWSPGQPIVYEMPGMSCDPGTDTCALDDGSATDVACAADADCYGIGVFLRARGAGAFDFAGYQLQASVERAADLLCVPDLFENDDARDPMFRVHAAIPPPLRAYDTDAPTLPLGQTVSLDNLRLCGGPGAADEILDADHLTFWMQPGEQVFVTLRQSLGQSVRLDSYPGSDTIPQNFVEGSDEEMIVSADARRAGYYSVRVSRTGGDGQAGYLDSTPYALSMIRSPAGFVADTACQDPARINLVNSVAETVGSVLAANDDHRPLECLGGEGPDRVYVVRVPHGAGVLRATVTPDDDPNYDPAVAIRTDCAVANSELACNEDDPESFDPFSQARAQAVVQGGAVGRDVFVIVDSFSASTAGRFRLQLRYIDGDQCDLETGICIDPCEDVSCSGTQLCNPNDGQCVDCLINEQCNAGELCVDSRCVGGADREISSWGADGTDEPDCPNGDECTVDEMCAPIPFTSDQYCLMGCGEDLVCPEGFTCCAPPIPVGPGNFCAPVNNPLRGLCE